jgi:hypothetical protein
VWCGHRFGGHRDHGAAGSNWNAANTTILQVIMLAQASIQGQNLGYRPDTLLVSDTVWAYLASNPTLATLLARENLNNPVYTGRFSSLAGLDVVHVPAANMPGADGTKAWVLDTVSLGFIATEDLGGGYLPPVTSSSRRRSVEDRTTHGVSAPASTSPLR